MLADEKQYAQKFETALALYGEEMVFGCPARPRHTTAPLTAARRRPGSPPRSPGLFRQKRAEPLAEQARTELTATGEKPARDTTGNLRSLTAQVQVALIAAQRSHQSRSCRGTVLEPKNGRAHLGNTYRKLSVRSRAELARGVEDLN